MLDVSVGIVALSAGSLLTGANPNPMPPTLPVVLVTVLQQDGTDVAVNTGIEMGNVLPAPVSDPEPKLKPVDPEPKPVKPVKPLNAPVCTAHATQTQRYIIPAADDDNFCFLFNRPIFCMLLQG